MAKKDQGVLFPNNWRDPAKLTAVFDKLVEAKSLMFDMRRHDGAAAAAIDGAQKAVLAELADSVTGFAGYLRLNKRKD